MADFLVRDFIQQRLGDRDTNDYFNKPGELEGICWRFVPSGRRCTTISLPMCALSTRMTPLPTPTVNNIGSLWTYCFSPYSPGIYSSILANCVYNDYNGLFQPNHKYAIYQSNAYLNGIYCNPQPEVDEIAPTILFTAPVTGDVTLQGYPINLSMLLADIFDSIANDIGKLAIYQSTLGGTTDLRTAAAEASRQAANWRSGTMVYKSCLHGSRR